MKCKEINEKGSALIFTILILFILSVLGTALISVSMTNFTLTAHGKNYNTAYYLSDGAAEEVMEELDIITNNAEFYSLSEIDSYADTMNASFVSVTVEEDETITYSYDISGFKAALNTKFEEVYIQEILDNLKFTIETVDFSPSFEDNFEATTPVAVSLTSPVSLTSENISNSDSILIDVSGFYNNMERKIRLTIQIHVPSYTFKATGSGSVIHYYDFERGVGSDYELISWKEININ